MKPSEQIEQNCPVNQMNDPLFIQSILDYLDKQYLLEHQRHTNEGLSCVECRQLGLVVGGNPPLPSEAIKTYIKEQFATHDQIQWKKKLKEEWWENALKKNNMNYDPAISEIFNWYEQKIEDILSLTLKHLHDEIMAKQVDFEGGYPPRDVKAVTVEDLQAIFTRYGVGDKK